MSYPVGSTVRCKHLFESQHPAELGLEPGMLVRVLEPDRDGWTFCALVSDPQRTGCAPTKFLEPVDADKSSSSAAAGKQGRSTPADQRSNSAAKQPPQQDTSGTSTTSGSGGNRPAPQNYSALAAVSNTAANNAAALIRSNSTPAGGAAATQQQQSFHATAVGSTVPDAAALMEGFHKNELYFQQLLVQRQESTAALDGALREAATEIDLAKEKHASMVRRLKELDHMVTKERKRWKDRVEEERMLLAQRAGASGATSGGQQQQQQQQSAGAPSQLEYGRGAQPWRK